VAPATVISIVPVMPVCGTAAGTAVIMYPVGTMTVATSVSPGKGAQTMLIVSVAPALSVKVSVLLTVAVISTVSSCTGTVLYVLLEKVLVGVEELEGTSVWLMFAEAVTTVPTRPKTSLPLLSGSSSRVPVIV
jgi:hypothetical protein